MVWATVGVTSPLKIGADTKRTYRGGAYVHTCIHVYMYARIKVYMYAPVGAVSLPRFFAV